MELGTFSISLAVQDLAASRAFYEKLDFQVIGGDADQNWLILQNGINTVGLFQGMFPDNILTFNPGWAQDATGIESFEDVRAIQARLETAGIDIDTKKADPDSDGPAHFITHDPDGNVIMFDQHVSKPE